MKNTTGIHHITAIVGHPQENADFYTKSLGLRLIKKTVNFDDPHTYHLYFGDQQANPGTIITFFPWVEAEQGKIGGGQVGVTSFAVPANSLSYWEKRLAEKGVPLTRTVRFSEQVLQFSDPHGLKLELVERSYDNSHSWSESDVDPAYAISGFAGATLYSTNPEATVETLTETMGLKKLGEEDRVLRLKTNGDLASIIDIPLDPVMAGEMGVGTVHHIAWRADDDADHLKWHEHVSANAYQVTDIKDRNYFKALYFREYGNILFEIATDTPGFTVDESLEALGESLKLPEPLEKDRENLERILPPIVQD
ncbi:Glyoxalase family protein [Alkalibacterium sp. AK22]|uniref:ring-cleaving dioxygenase n=1 Tax=Alkalibacterium sp. AK22 TaxID=1229520 RepID=UPI00044F51A4|nr:ring-cleaving dioxygenase [Alkalibacterium sp. AK22]EXJ23045.1 Glyoxalase family protein [Alkalibacterium sp. AK22]